MKAVEVEFDFAPSTNQISQGFERNFITIFVYTPKCRSNSEVASNQCDLVLLKRFQRMIVLLILNYWEEEEADRSQR